MSSKIQLLKWLRATALVIATATFGCASEDGDPPGASKETLQKAEAERLAGYTKQVEAAPLLDGDPEEAYRLTAVSGIASEHVDMWTFRVSESEPSLVYRCYRWDVGRPTFRTVRPTDQNVDQIRAMLASARFWDPSKDPPSGLMTLDGHVYFEARRGNQVRSVTTETTSLDLEALENTLRAFAGPVPACLLADLPIPEAAYEVKKYPVDSRQRHELSFKVDLTYPSKEVLEPFEEYFASEKWTKCEGGMEDWDSFVHLDLEPDQPVLVHQLLRYWIKRDQNMYATMVLNYFSEGVDEGRARPTNTTQHVTLLVVDDMADLDQHLRRRRVECPPEEPGK